MVSMMENSMGWFVLHSFLASIGNFVVQVGHDAKTHPHLLVCLGVVRAHLGPPTCKRTSSHLLVCHAAGRRSTWPLLFSNVEETLGALNTTFYTQSLTVTGHTDHRAQQAFTESGDKEEVE